MFIKSFGILQFNIHVHDISNSIFHSLNVDYGSTPLDDRDDTGTHKICIHVVYKTSMDNQSQFSYNI